MKQGVIGIDVGTGSARAGVFDLNGKLLGIGKHDILLHHGPGGIAEHESADIRAAVCAATRIAVSEADSIEIIGVGVDAACSLVVEGQQLSDGGSPERDVIVWMDHRAVAEAEEINAGGYEVLDFVGGRISPEMQTPKLLWLSRHRPDAFSKALRFMDLADWLTCWMTGSDARSSCTVTCKWTYLAHEAKWDESYFRAIGLGSLADEGFTRIGTDIRTPGSPTGSLSHDAAQAMGLPVGVPVAAGLIDAHAGGVGTIGASEGKGNAVSRMAYVFGTSACTMSSHQNRVNVPGVWGPYFDAMLPDHWLNEGGQSAAGAALDQLVRMHPAFEELSKREEDVLDYLTQQALNLESPAVWADRAAHLTVVPDFNGNRAPLADPSARAVVAGLDMSRDEDGLLDLFIAGIIGIGCGLRQILEVQVKAGLNTDAIVISGGAGANLVAQQIFADVTGLDVLVPETSEPVLLGAAMLGAVASGAKPDLPSAMSQMSGISNSISDSKHSREVYDNIYRRYVALQTAATR